MITTATAPLPPSPNDEIDHDALDEDYVLTAAFVEKVVDASDAGDGLRLRSLLEDLHPADVADLMGFLTAEHRTVVVLWLPPDLLAETLPELDDNIREEVLERVPHLTLAEALQELDSDDAAAVVEDLEDDQREKVLAAMPVVDPSAAISKLAPLCSALNASASCGTSFAPSVSEPLMTMRPAWATDAVSARAAAAVMSLVIFIGC